MAEAIRGYLLYPNWFKTVAPNTAKRIRAYVNANPKINRSIQFNSLVGLGGTGIGAATLGDREERREPKR